MQRKLCLLQVGHIGVIRLIGGRYVQYLVIRVEEDHVVYYTAKGMRKLIYPTSVRGKKRAEELLGLDEASLIFMGLIAIMHFSRIETVLS